MRGRLIFPFLAEIYRLDTRGVETTGRGYDPDFKEIIKVDLNNDGIGETGRIELQPIRVPCQVETKVFEQLKMLPSGNAPNSQIELICHFKDIEWLGLIDEATGEPLIHPGDRLDGIYDMEGQLVQKVRNPPGLYVTEVRSIGFGLNMMRPKRNLLLLCLEERQFGSRRLS